MGCARVHLWVCLSVVGRNGAAVLWWTVWERAAEVIVMQRRVDTTRWRETGAWSLAAVSSKGTEIASQWAQETGREREGEWTTERERKREGLRAVEFFSYLKSQSCWWRVIVTSAALCQYEKRDWWLLQPLPPSYSSSLFPSLPPSFLCLSWIFKCIFFIFFFFYI